MMWLLYDCEALDELRGALGLTMYSEWQKNREQLIREDFLFSSLDTTQLSVLPLKAETQLGYPTHLCPLQIIAEELFTICFPHPVSVLEVVGSQRQSLNLWDEDRPEVAEEFQFMFAGKALTISACFKAVTSSPTAGYDLIFTVCCLCRQSEYRVACTEETVSFLNWQPKCISFHYCLTS